MPEDLILDNSHEPTMDEICRYFDGQVGKRWLELTHFLENNYKTKQQTDYSMCSGKPGWNIKYKKSGKALCTLYPEKDRFTVLIVLGKKDRESFEEAREEFSPYINELYDQCVLFNGTKWLMLEVTDDIVLEDAKVLIIVKTRQKKK